MFVLALNLPGSASQPRSSANILFTLSALFFPTVAALSVVQKSNDASNEKNRAAVATINAEIRRSKAALKNEIPKLQKLALKKVYALNLAPICETH